MIPSIHTPEDERELSNLTLQLEAKRQGIITAEADHIRFQGYIRAERATIHSLNDEKADLENYVASLKESQRVRQRDVNELNARFTELTSAISNLNAEIASKSASIEARLMELKGREDKVSNRESKCAEWSTDLTKIQAQIDSEKEVHDTKVAKLKKALE